MTTEYEAVTESEWKDLATTEITHLTDEEKDYLPAAWDEWIARVRRDAARQAEAERDEWRQTALDERAAALDALEQIKVRDALIKAVRELHRSVGLTAYTGPRIKPSGEPIPDDTQVCDYCTDPDELGWCEYPCPTIRALDGDA